MSEQTVRLTQYSAGCGCKIPLKEQQTEQTTFVGPNLLVGNETRAISYGELIGELKSARAGRPMVEMR